MVGLIAITVGVAVFGLRQDADDPAGMTSSAVGVIEQDTKYLGTGIVDSKGQVSEPAETAIFVDNNIAPEPAIVQAEAANKPPVAPVELNTLPSEPIALSDSIIADYSFVIEKVVVNKGDGLWQLCREIYGEVDSELVREVLKANPHIRNPNDLIVGEEITFPRLAAAGRTARMTNAVNED